MKSQKLVINYVQQLYDCAISNWIYQGKKWLPSEKLGSQTLFHFTAVNQQSFFQVTKTSPQLINQDSYLTAIIWMSKGKRLVVGPVKSDDLIFKKSDLFDGICLIQNVINNTELTRTDFLRGSKMFKRFKRQQGQKITRHLFDNYEQNFRHNPYDEEVRELAAIASGNEKQLRTVLNEQKIGSFGKLAEQPLRSYKNLAIVSIALDARAGIKSGMSHEDAFALSDAYIRELETARTVESTFTLSIDAKYRYLKIVRDLLQSNEKVTPLITKTKSIIAIHLHEKLTVKQLAKETKVTSNYLSSQFKHTTGKNLTTYIHQQKISASKNELIYTQQPISTIAVNYAFNSGSHYTEIFKKLVGNTPRQFRQKYAKIDS